LFQKETSIKASFQQTAKIQDGITLPKTAQGVKEYKTGYIEL
jgi:hypothetical protein